MAGQFITIDKGGSKQVIFIGDKGPGAGSPGGANQAAAGLESTKAGHALVVKSKKKAEEDLAAAKEGEGIKAGNATVVQSGSLPGNPLTPEGSGAVMAGNAIVVPSGSKGKPAGWNGYNVTSLIKLAHSYGLDFNQTKQLMGKLGVSPNEGTIKQQLYLAKKGSPGATLLAAHQAEFESHVANVKGVQLAPTAAQKVAGMFGEEKAATPAAKVPVKGAFPSDLSKLTTVKSLGGSTGAKLVQDENGNQFVHKTGKNEGQLREEHAAEQMYRALGVPVPASKLYETPNGPVKLSEYISNAKELGQLSGPEKYQAMYAAQQHFVADALMANWDAVGLEKDNMLMGSDGTLHRADVGGSLRYRAQGGLKGDKFGSVPNELFTLRDSSVNPSAAQVYEGLTHQNIIDQAKAVLSKRDALLAATPADLKPIMTARLDNLQKIADAGKIAINDNGSSSEVEAAMKHSADYQQQKAATTTTPKATATESTTATHWKAAIEHLSAGKLPSTFSGPAKAMNDVKKAVANYEAHHSTGQPLQKTQVMYKVGAKHNALLSNLAQDEASAEAHQTPLPDKLTSAQSAASGSGATRESPKQLTKADLPTGTETPHPELSAQTRDLKPGEHAAIKSFTGSYHGPIREVDYKGENNGFAGTHESLYSAMNKLPQYKGLVYRGVGMKQSQIDQLVNGDKVELNAVSSFSRTPQTAASFASSNASYPPSVEMGIIKPEEFKHPVIFKINQSFTGRAVEHISSHSSEKEVLFGKGARFQVASQYWAKLPGHGEHVFHVIEGHEVPESAPKYHPPTGHTPKE